MERLTILGATGSIGASTLDVAARHPDRFRIHALSGYRRMDVLASACRTHRPKRVVVSDPAAADVLQNHLQGADLDLQIDWGGEALCEIAREADVVMAAIVGSPGLAPTLAAANAGRRVLLANKEALVMAGPLFMEAVRQSGAVLLPIDSEHNAVFQCLPAEKSAHQGVAKITLTASGGPFRTWTLEQMRSATPAQAVAHPNWAMGQKISVDSATMMNKGLEVIEARWLFDVAPEMIDVVIHPQSVIHSMVSYCDGSTLAQLGQPDMRTPIAHALGYPERIDAGVATVDLTRMAGLTFEKPDTHRFPCLSLAFQALNRGAAASCALNAANEVAVDAFLSHRLKFTDIANVVARVLDTTSERPLESIEALLAFDGEIRLAAREALEPYA